MHEEEERFEKYHAYQYEGIDWTGEFEEPVLVASNPTVIHRRGKFKPNQRKQRKGKK